MAIYQNRFSDLRHANPKLILQAYLMSCNPELNFDSGVYTNLKYTPPSFMYPSYATLGVNYDSSFWTNHHHIENSHQIVGFQEIEARFSDNQVVGKPVAFRLTSYDVNFMSEYLTDIKWISSTYAAYFLVMVGIQKKEHPTNFAEISGNDKQWILNNYQLEDWFRKAQNNKYNK